MFGSRALPNLQGSLQRVPGPLTGLSGRSQGRRERDKKEEYAKRENEKTNDINVVETCQQYFSFRLPSDILQKRTKKFLDNITS